MTRQMFHFRFVCIFVLGFYVLCLKATLISVHGTVTCCEKPATSCGYPEEYIVTINGESISE